MTKAALPAAIPSLNTDGGLRQYLMQIRRFPVLAEEEEFMLAKRWQEHGDVAAAHQLVTSHLRLVAKIAMKYRGYGLPTGDLIAEGNIGLMQAVKKFDPDKGFRLATYAIWWIKASIQEYVLKSWSMVKIGTSAAQKRLFFNLRKLKNQLLRDDTGMNNLSQDQAQEIATQLEVGVDDVREMEQRMSGADQYLNSRMSADSEDEWIDHLADTRDNQETTLIEHTESKRRSSLLERALAKLTDREQDIIRARHLKEEPDTLEDLSQVYHISRERVRQIEARAMEKLQKEMREEVK
jgi:RNA polymerase sigma-32 factor